MEVVDGASGGRRWFDRRDVRISASMTVHRML